MSAVVVNYRTADLTEACVAGLRADGIDQVIVVDSASGDDHLAGDEVIHLPVNRGYGAAANAGARSATGDVVIICNPDLEVAPGTVEALAKALYADPGLAAVGPRIDRPDGTRYPSARAFPSLTDAAGHAFIGLLTTRNRWSRRYLRSEAEAPGPVDWVSGAFMAVRRVAFEAVGGFDESYFMFMEDVDLCRRLRLAGWGVAYVPAGRVVHLEGVSRATAPYRMILSHHRSLLRYGWRNAGPGQRVMFPVVAAGVAARAVALLVQARVRRGRARPLP